MHPISTTAAPIIELPRFAAGSGPVQAAHQAPLSDFDRSAAEKSSGMTAAPDPDDSDLDVTTVPGHCTARQATTEAAGDRQRRQELIDEILRGLDSAAMETLMDVRILLLWGKQGENESTAASP